MTVECRCLFMIIHWIVAVCLWNTRVVFLSARIPTVLLRRVLRHWIAASRLPVLITVMYQPALDSSGIMLVLLIKLLVKPSQQVSRLSWLVILSYFPTFFRLFSIRVP